MVLPYLSSGLFLGWSLGANDAANVFGSAVGSRMIRWRTAALIASIFVIIGAVVSGAGTTHTLGKLGAVNALGGAFTVSLAAALAVYWMTKLKLPVSTSQAIVGAIIGWNLFSSNPTDPASLSKILLTWVLCPLLAAVFAALFYYFYRWSISRIKVHILTMDAMTRLGLIIAGAFGSYSLGANNIANVMGVFVPVSPFKELDLGFITLSSAQQLFLIGGIAITIGILTYSRHVMDTVGKELMKLTPEIALLVVLSHSIVLFLFSSQELEAFLISIHLPPIPLVPVSSSQAIVGAIIGIGMAKSGRGIRFNILGRIASGWITTPVIAGIFSFTSLFIAQNVFDQEVFSPDQQTETAIHALSGNTVPSYLPETPPEDTGLNQQTVEAGRLLLLRE